MSKQRIPSALREALFRAYGEKCPYTGLLLDLRNLQVDHILPEKLAEDSSRLAEIISELGLDPSFNIHGIENLISTWLTFLTMTRQKKPAGSGL